MFYHNITFGWREAITLILLNFCFYFLFFVHTAEHELLPAVLCMHRSDILAAAEFHSLLVKVKIPKLQKAR
jgi:hypothetical protein